MENLTRNAALAAIFTLLWSACTTGNPGPGGEEAESEGESEAESEGDQTCPPEGCVTEMPCRDDDSCPTDDPCRDYFCDGRDGFCRYLETDEDGDGYVRESCGGEDCDDRSAEKCRDTPENEPCGVNVHPGAEEECDGADNDCDRQVDEDLAEQPCGPKSEIGICRVGTRSCTDGGWSGCEGAVYPEEQEGEACDGLDNDCDGETDNLLIGCTSSGGCRGFQRCVGTSRGECDAPDPTPTETNCHSNYRPDSDTDCDGLHACDDDDCRGQECTCSDGTMDYPGICYLGYCDCS